MGTSEPTRGHGAGRALAIVLPSLALAWAWPAALADDLAPETTGAGLAALCALPAAALALLRPPTIRPRGLAFLSVALGIGAAWLAVGAAFDTVDAERAYLGALVGVVMLLAGAGLGASGRRALVRLGTALGALLVLGGWLDPARAGALGNSGDLSEAALPCAVLGVVLATGAGAGREERRAWRILGGLVALGFTVWCLATPSITGAAAFVVATAAAAVGLAVAPDVSTGSGGRALARRRAPLALGAAGGVVLLALLALHGRDLLDLAGDGAVASAAGLPDAGEEARDDPLAVGDLGGGDLGGLAVRLDVWSSTSKLVRANPWSGVGPGQFARAFPPFRDPDEIERSTLSRALPGETEVEHPHNDWLVAFAELGLLGGLAWCAFLACVLLGAWRALRGAEPARVALGAGAVAVLVDALAHAPLTDNPAAASFAMGLFGTLLARDRGTGPSAATSVRSAARLVPATALALLVLAAPDARALVRHGRTLGRLAHPAETRASDPVVARARRGLKTVAEALAARPDSTLARTLRARLLEQSGASPAVLLEAWSLVLAERPHRFEALMQVGTLHARAGNASEARAYYDHALKLDPRHPGLLRNRVRLELLEGRIEHGLDTLATLAERGPPDPDWVERFGAELLLRGKDREGFALLERIGANRSDDDGNGLWQLSKTLHEDGRELLADAYAAQAHRLWAREHAEAGRYHDAVRSYRQSLRLTLAFEPEGALRIRMELAAAALGEGERELAGEQLAGERPTAADWAGMPSWAGEALLATGWFDA